MLATFRNTAQINVDPSATTRAKCNMYSRLYPNESTSGEIN